MNLGHWPILILQITKAIAYFCLKILLEGCAFLCAIVLSLFALWACLTPSNRQDSSENSAKQRLCDMGPIAPSHLIDVLISMGNIWSASIQLPDTLQRPPLRFLLHITSLLTRHSFGTWCILLLALHAYRHCLGLAINHILWTIESQTFLPLYRQVT